MDERDLITLAQKKNEAAFLEIFNRYKGGLKVHVGKVVIPSDVEDICLQTFMKAFLHIESYNPEKAEFRTWLYTIGWNTALDHAGKKKREMDNMPTTSIEGDEGSTANISTQEKPADEAISSQEDYDKLIGYINGLAGIYREIAIYRFIDEKEYNEIAERTGLPLNTVKTRIRRAKEILQKMMLDDEEEE